MKFIRKRAPELPSEGGHAASILSVEDIGIVRTRKWGQKNMTKVTFQIEDQIGKRGPIVVSQNYTNLVSPNSNLSKLLAVIDLELSDDGDDQESDQFIGRNLFIIVKHVPGRHGTIHARVVGFSKTKRQQAFEVIEDIMQEAKKGATCETNSAN
jgi:hypothetical protein